MRINFYPNQFICKSPFCFTVLFLLTLIFFKNPQNVASQSNVNGLLQNYNAFQTTNERELIAGRNRLKLQFTRPSESGGLYFETDLVNRYNGSGAFIVDNEVQIRELYFERFLDSYDIRVGKQNIIWGRSDGGFVTDILTPVDLREFLTQEPEDLRIGLTALSITRYFGGNSLQFVLSPTFQRDLFPAPDARWFPVNDIPSPIPVEFIEDDSPSTLSDIQAAVQYRIRSISNLDLDLMLYYWTHPMPTFAVEPNFFNPPNLPSVDLIETYQPSLMGGYSLNYELGSDWFLTSESLFVKNRLFTFLPVSVNLLESALNDVGSAIQVLQQFELRDDRYLVEKPWIQNMVGLQTSVKGTIISAQAYLETILNYEERILPQQYFPYATLLLTRSFMRDRLQVLSLGRYNFYGEDFWFQLQGIYEISDGLEFAAGTNLFYGEEVSPFYGHFSFNQFKENSFFFTRLSYYF